MPSVLAPSNIFPIDPSLSYGESESACSYVAYEMGQKAVQPYRGSFRPSTAEHPASSTRAEVQALMARVSALQHTFADTCPADELQQLQQLCGKLEQLAALDKANRPSAGQRPSASEGVAYFDSCAKFSGEASRVRDTGRLPFASDNFKIVA